MISQLPPFHRDLPRPAFPSVEQTDRPSPSIKMKRSERTKGHRFTELRQRFNELWKCRASSSRRWSLQLHPGASHQMQLAAYGRHTGRGSGAGSSRGPGDRWGEDPEESRPAAPGRRGWDGESSGNAGSGPSRSPRPGPVPGTPARELSVQHHRPRPGSCPFSTTVGPPPGAPGAVRSAPPPGSPQAAALRQWVRQDKGEGPSPEEITPDLLHEK